MKYKLTKNTIEYKGRTLYQIVALKDFGNVKKGKLGGWIESEYNLSQEGDCWVYENAKVYGKARVFDNAKVFWDAEIYGNAFVYGDAHIFGSAKVCGSARACENASLYIDNIFSKGSFVGSDKELKEQDDLRRFWEEKESLDLL